MSDFVTVAKEDELDPGESMVVGVEGREVALFNIDGKFYAIGNTCTHMRGPLSDGDVKDNTVTCPWHGADFDIKSGEALSRPARGSVPKYEVTVEDSKVKINI